MDRAEFLELFTIITGAFAAITAFTMAGYFARTKGAIGHAVAVDKFAEGISMLVILIFAVAYYFNLFVKMPIELAATLRISAIACTTFSSLHLAYRTRQVIITMPDPPEEDKCQ